MRITIARNVMRYSCESQEIQSALNLEQNAYILLNVQSNKLPTENNHRRVENLSWYPYNSPRFSYAVSNLLKLPSLH